MLIKSKGIVIKTIRYSESALIVKIYTLSHGLLSFYVQGVYSKKAVLKPSYFLPMQKLELDFYFHEHKNLLRLKEVHPEISSPDLHWQINKSPVSLILSELVTKTVKEIEKNEEMFGFLSKALTALSNAENNTSNFLLFFIVHFCYFLGFFPSGNYSLDTPFFNLQTGRFSEINSENAFSLSDLESKILSQIIESSIDKFSSYTLSYENRSRLLEKMLTYYEIHVEGFSGLTSMGVLKEVFSKR